MLPSLHFVKIIPQHSWTRHTC